MGFWSMIGVAAILTRNPEPARMTWPEAVVTVAVCVLAAVGVWVLGRMR
jgi:hypothetical protein